MSIDDIPRAKDGMLAHYKPRTAAEVQELARYIARIRAAEITAKVRAPSKPGAAPVIRSTAPRSGDSTSPARKIMDDVAAQCGVTLADLRSPNRRRAIAWPRQYAMWLIHKQFPNYSLSRIARLFNRSCHSTVFHAIRKMDRLNSSEAAQ